MNKLCIEGLIIDPKHSELWEETRENPLRHNKNTQVPHLRVHNTQPSQLHLGAARSISTALRHTLEQAPFLYLKGRLQFFKHFELAEC